MKRRALSIVVLALLVVAIALLICSAAMHPKETDWQSYVYNNVSINELAKAQIFAIDENGNAEITTIKNGDYTLGLRYIPDKSASGDVEFTWSLDGGDFQKGILNTIRYGGIQPLRGANGNDLRPSQKIFDKFALAPLRNQEMYNQPFVISLNAGVHLFSMKDYGETNVSHIILTAINTPNYADYIQTYASQTSPKNYINIIQAENMYLKSGSSVYSTYDRSSPETLPYHPMQLRLNTIGAKESFGEPGDWANWKVNAPEDGLYAVGLRYRQNAAKGFFSMRKISIDGEIPFKEFESVIFAYNTGWQNNVIADGDKPYLIYLTKGEHILTLEATLGNATDIVVEMNETLSLLSDIYREMLMITGPSPDPMRDYELYKAIPGLQERLSDIHFQLEKSNGELRQFGNLSLGILPELILQISDFADSDYLIPRRLSTLNSNISAFADWLFEISHQPLEVDYVYICSPDYKIPKGDADFFIKAAHETASFIGSFTHNYDSFGTESSKNSVKVWLNLGRDQTEVIRRLINERFTPETGISVQLEVVQGALLKAIIAGRGPDVNLFTKRGDIMNLAFRDTVYPIDGFNGFSELKTHYAADAFLPYEYEEKTYAVPATQSFFMMFTRDDILTEAGITPPETWEELVQITPLLQSRYLNIGLPYQNLDSYALMGSSIGTLSLFPTLMEQNGASLYNEGLTTANLDTITGRGVFTMWTDFYRMYDFPLYKDDFNRFRSGEMPIVITEYGFYNRLVGSAPEISGLWSMNLVPGTVTNGVINRNVTATGSADIILKDCENPQNAWIFLSWWQSAETQAAFSRDFEDQISVLGRYTPANLDALPMTYWKESERKTLLEQWKNARELPEIPGGFLMIRAIDNAFRGTYYDNRNPLDSLRVWNKTAIRDITDKRMELGLEATK